MNCPCFFTLRGWINICCCGVKCEISTLGLSIANQESADTSHHFEANFSFQFYFLCLAAWSEKSGPEVFYSFPLNNEKAPKTPTSRHDENFTLKSWQFSHFPMIFVSFSVAKIVGGNGRHEFWETIVDFLRTQPALVHFCIFTLYLAHCNESCMVWMEEKYGIYNWAFKDRSRKKTKSYEIMNVRTNSPNP